MPGLVDLPAWQALQEHRGAMAEVHMRDLFARDPQRFERFSLRTGDILFDYSKNRVTEETIRLLCDLARQADLASKIGRSQRLELQVARSDEETALRLLAEAPGVSARRENGTIVAAGAEWAAIPGLVTSLASAGVHIYRVAPQEVSLEDTYFALQQEKEEMS
jgi:hypothetical protein